MTNTFCFRHRFLTLYYCRVIPRTKKDPNLEDLIEKLAYLGGDDTDARNLIMDAQLRSYALIEPEQSVRKSGQPIRSSQRIALTKAGLEASDSEEIEGDEVPLARKTKAKDEKRPGKLQKKAGSGSGSAPKATKETEKDKNAVELGSALVTLGEIEETGMPPTTPPGEMISEKDPSVSAEREKIEGTETPKVGAEAPAATPDATATDKSKDPVGPATSGSGKEASLGHKTSHSPKGTHGTGNELERRSLPSL